MTEENLEQKLKMKREELRRLGESSKDSETIHSLLKRIKDLENEIKKIKDDVKGNQNVQNMPAYSNAENTDTSFNQAKEKQDYITGNDRDYIRPEHPSSANNEVSLYQAIRNAEQTLKRLRDRASEDINKIKDRATTDMDKLFGSESNTQNHKTLSERIPDMPDTQNTKYLSPADRRRIEKIEKEKQILEALADYNYDHVIDTFYNGSLANAVSGICKDLKFDLAIPNHRPIAISFADHIIDLAESEDVIEKKEELFKMAIKVYEINQTVINRAADMLRDFYMNKSQEALDSNDIRTSKQWLNKYSNVRSLYKGI
ncbi:MAG: hypothetical protein ACP5NW_01105 [Candidatus Woesearchaeota archaeon]